MTTKASSFANKDDVRDSPKLVAPNTWRFTRDSDGATVYRLHETDIIAVTPDGKTTLNTNGWKTVTTKERINRLTNYQVWQKKGAWYVGPHDQATPYFDGIVLPDDIGKVDPTIEAEAKMGKAIDKFVKLLDRGTPEPSGGDCFFCMADKGGTFGDDEHIRSHIMEGYLHGTLLLNALAASGYQDPNFALHVATWNHKRSLKRYLRQRLHLVR